MKKMLFVFVFIAINGTAFAQDITFTKQEVYDIVVESTTEALCTDTITACVDIAKSECADEIKKFMTAESKEDPCENNIPKEGADLDTIADVMADTVSCVVIKFKEKHKEAMEKNKDTKPCQDWFNEE